MSHHIHTLVTVRALRQTLSDYGRRHMTRPEADLTADMITRAEIMGVSSHGLHYFVHSIIPLLEQQRVNRARPETRGHVIWSQGEGGVGFMSLQNCLNRASRMARSKGIALVQVKNPGKVGAFRVYCPELMKKGQLVVMMKNTAASVAVPGTANALIGTNPLCIGLPDSDFIYDASMSTVATNKMRVKQKEGQRFSHSIGVNENVRPTKKPEAILKQRGALWPFSHGDYWYKSFFLGVAIEAISAMVGGQTQIKARPQMHKRLFSDEGLLAIVVDRSVFPEYANYLKEWPRLRRQLKRHKIRIPGSYNARMGRVKVLREDWEQVNRL